MAPEAPWFGAMLRFICDPAAEMDPAALPDWLAGPWRARALIDPAIRGRLGRWLVRMDDLPALLDCLSGSNRTRLVLVPPAEAMALILRLAAWFEAPRINAVLRRAEIEGVRAAIGAEALAFAQRQAPLLPRPTAALVAAVDAVAPLPDAGAEPTRLPARGAVLFGLAIGAVPPAATARLRLRHPAALWELVARQCADTDADTDAGAAAASAIHRLVRDTAPPWSNWLH